MQVKVMQNLLNRCFMSKECHLVAVLSRLVFKCDLKKCYAAAFVIPWIITLILCLISGLGQDHVLFQDQGQGHLM